MLNRIRKKVGAALRWSERYTKTDMIYLTKGGFWLTASKALSISSSFLSSIVFANFLPEETYGVFRYVLSIISLLTIPTLHGIDTALTRAISRGVNVSIAHTLQTRIKWGVLGGVGSLALGGYYLLMGNEILAAAFLFAAIFVPVMDPLHIYTAILNGAKKFKLLARDEIITRALTTILLVGTVLYTTNILIILAVYFISTTVLRCIFLKLNLSRLQNKPTGTDTEEVVAYGKHLTAMSVLGQISAQLDKVLIFHYVGGAALAAYYLALMPMKQVQTFFSGITALALPKFSNNSMENIRATLPQKLLRLYVLIIPTVLLYIFAAPYIFSFIYPLYMSAVAISQLLILQLLFFPLSLLSTALTSQAYKKKLYTHSSTHAIIRIGLLLILVPTFGVYGVVAAVLTTSALSSVLLVFLFFKR